MTDLRFFSGWGGWVEENRVKTCQNVANYWTRLAKIVICGARADQLFADAEGCMRQIIDLRDTDKSRYFVRTTVRTFKDNE